MFQDTSLSEGPTMTWMLKTQTSVRQIFICCIYLFIFFFFERQCIHSSSQKTAASKKDITQKIRAIIREEVAAPAECQFAHGKSAVLM